MAISFVGSATGTNTAIIPAHQAGDLILVAAFRMGTTSAPSVASGFTQIGSPSGSGTTGENAISRAVGWKIAASSSESVGTWTNANQLVVVVYRGTSASPIGINTSRAQNLSTIQYDALAGIDPSSWVVLLAGISSTTSTIESPPAGTVLRANAVLSGEVVAFDTDGAAGSWSSKTVALGVSARFVTIPVEIKAPPSVTISATCATTTTTGKAIGKLLSILSATTTTARKTIAKPIAATVATATTAIKLTGKRISATVASTVSTSSQSLATVIINASVSTAVTARKAVGKAVSVTSTGAVGIVKRAGKAISAMATGAVTVRKGIGKTIAAAASAVVSMTKTRALVISASVVSAVSVSRGFFVTIAAAASSAVTIGGVALLGWVPIKVFKAGDWIVGKLKIWRGGAWVKPDLKRYHDGEWVDL